MNAATLTAIRARANEGPDGDHVFLLGCQLGTNGPAALAAFQIASREAGANGPTHTAEADKRIADRIVELVERSDPSGLVNDKVNERITQLNTFADAAAIVGEGDSSYVDWLLAAGVVFYDEVGCFPHDLHEPVWRSCYDKDFHPGTAARYALHQKPMVVRTGNDLSCPVCHAPDRIGVRVVEVSVWKVLVDDDGYYANRPAEVPGSEQVVCLDCTTELRLPQSIQAFL